jgi:hypothetical protein
MDQSNFGRTTKYRFPPRDWFGRGFDRGRPAT